MTKRVIDLTYTNTPLAKRVAALYDAMKKNGDGNLAFLIVNTLTNLSDYACFVAKQEIYNQHASLSMDSKNYFTFQRLDFSARNYTRNHAVLDVTTLNNLSKKYNVELVAGSVEEQIRKEEASGNFLASVNSSAYQDFAKEVLDTYFTNDYADSASVVG